MDEKLKQFIGEIKSVFSDAKIFLFGSRARGDFDSGSDYDLIIISEEFGETSIINRAGIVWRRTETGIAADLLCYTPREFEKIREEPFVIKDAMQHAIAL